MSNSCDILIIEDNIDDFELCERALQKCQDVDYRLRHARTGSEGLAALKTYIPDAVLLDYSLPNNNGLEVLRKIHDDYPHLPVVILTGQGSDALAAQLVKAGAEDYIIKSTIDTISLHMAIEAAIKKDQQVQKHSSLNVLIVDDNPDDREKCLRSLSKIIHPKYSYQEAISGTDMFKNISGQGLPDCILLDYSLPGQNGLELLKEIISRYPFLPVIMMTGQGNERVAVQAIKEGAQNYIVKSDIDKDTLNRAIKTAVKNLELEHRLLEKDKEIHDAKQLQDLMLFHNPDLIFVKDEKHRIIQANKSFLDMHPGIKQSDIIGQTTAKYYSENEANNFLAEDHLAFEKGYIESVDHIGFPNGKQHTLFTRKIRFENAEGQPFILGISRDVTEREKLINTLMESNEQLERFAYICSHDLQEPLRMIRSFSEKLQQHMGEQFKNDEKGQKYFKFIIEGASRAQALIADILKYSSIDSDTNTYETVSLKDILEGIQANMHVFLEEHDGKITFDTLPDIRGNKTQIFQLFQNLINNGMKYQKPGEKPVVHVGVIDFEDHWQFSITDNGIGMEDRHLKKIFDVFKRLHKKNQYPGTGIGLAICKKVVERHGGKIWVESQKGVGSTFHFTILKPEKASLSPKSTQEDKNKNEHEYTHENKRHKAG